MALGTPANEVQGTLSASFTRGTDTNIVLNSGEGANFPNSPQVVRLTDGDHWCLLEYSSVSTDTLVMASATDYALENNVSSGDETYTWPVGSAVELIMTADYLKELQDGTLHLDQTTPQTVINGVPLMEETPIGAADIKSLVNKEYVDLAVTSLGASYYMYDEDDATGYKTCYLDPSTDAETYLEKASLSDGDYIGGWVSADGIAPAKLLKGVYNWYVMLEKTAGTQSLRVYWQLIERKSDNSETVIATSSDSNEISSKESYLVPLQLNSDYIPDSGSRIVGKLYAAVSGGGNAPTVRVYYQDATSSRWEIPASSEIFKNIFVPYSGATQDIDLGGRGVSNLGKLNFDAATELTISSGAITITQTLHTVDTEGDASTDDLDTISGGTPGDVLYLRAADGSRTVVLKHGTGNIVTPDGNDYSLDDANKVVQLIYGSDSKWHLVGSAGGSGSQTPWTSDINADGHNLLDLGYGEFRYIPGDTAQRTLVAQFQGVTKEDKTIYVRTDGNDSNDGSADDSGHALLTIQKAVDIVSGLVIKDDITIKVADGTYSEQVDIGPLLFAGGSLTIEGNTTTPANCIVDGGSSCANGFNIISSVLTIKGFQIQNCTGHGIRYSGKDTYLTLENVISTANASGLYGGGGFLQVNETAPVCVFGDNTNYGLEFQWQATANIRGAEIDGNGMSGIYASYGSFVYARLCTTDPANLNGEYGAKAHLHSKVLVYEASTNPLNGSIAKCIPVAEPSWGSDGADMAQVYKF